jgi:hypothetical protein
LLVYPIDPGTIFSSVPHFLALGTVLGSTTWSAIPISLAGRVAAVPDGCGIQVPDEASTGKRVLEIPISPCGGASRSLRGCTPQIVCRSYQEVLRGAPSRYDEPTSRPLSSAHFFPDKRAVSSFVARLPARRSASFQLSAVRVEGKVTDSYPNGRVF